MQKKATILFKSYIEQSDISTFYKKIILNENLISNNPDFYLFYPKLFAPFFNFKDEDKLNKLCIAGYLYYLSIIHTDSLIDDKKIDFLPLINICQEEAVKLLTSLFDINSEFWKIWNLRREEYFEAVKLEKKLYTKRNVSKKDFELLADYKSAFGKIAIDSIHILTNKKYPKIYEEVLNRHIHFSVGFQLYDDIKDFKEDFLKKQFNWACYKLIKYLKKQQINPYILDIQTLFKYLYLSNISTKICKDSISNLKKSTLNIESSEEKKLWNDSVDKIKNSVIKYNDISKGYLQIVKTRTSLKNNEETKKNIPQNYANDTIGKGLKFILSDYKKDFPNLKHIMYLSKLEGFSSKSSVHIGDIFQRAMVADCLIDVHQKTSYNLEKVISSEINYLINNKLKNRIGTWSYFPSVKEIAADADDLGQIMQVLQRSNRTELISKHCQKAINVLLSDRYHTNGGFETWIIPKQSMTKLEKRQNFFNETKWGKGPDNEVMANFLYSLILYAPSNFKAKINLSIDYLLEQQNDLGFWESRWYYGNYYGTYVCLRAIIASKINCNLAIQKVYKYILNTQQKNGGWGLTENKSDSLSTAFALLILKNEPLKHKQAIQKAKEYLYKKQTEQGSWESVDFIKPKHNEPFRSEILTTAWCLRSLIN